MSERTLEEALRGREDYLISLTKSERTTFTEVPEYAERENRGSFPNQRRFFVDNQGRLYDQYLPCDCGVCDPKEEEVDYRQIIGPAHVAPLQPNHQDDRAAPYACLRCGTTSLTCFSPCLGSVSFALRCPSCGATRIIYEE